MKNKKIFFIQISIIIIFIILWHLLTSINILPTFIYSSPKLIIKTIISLIKEGSLLTHIYITLAEVIISFILGITLAFTIAIILYEMPTLSKILEPFFTMINSMPKVALGPLLIIIFGANKTTIIIMAILINMIVSMLHIYNGLNGCDSNYMKIMNIFHATKYQKLKMLVIPQAKMTITSCLKIHISLTFIGVIMGEFLVSKAGLGYLIIYGTQIFKMDYVITGIIILILLSWLIYCLICYISK